MFIVSFWYFVAENVGGCRDIYIYIFFVYLQRKIEQASREKTVEKKVDR